MTNNQYTHLWYNDDKCSSCADPYGYSSKVFIFKRRRKKVYIIIRNAKIEFMASIIFSGFIVWLIFLLNNREKEHN